MYSPAGVMDCTSELADKLASARIVSHKTGIDNIKTNNLTNGHSQVSPDQERHETVVVVGLGMVAISFMYAVLIWCS
jgi:phage-related protein